MTFRPRLRAVSACAVLLATTVPAFAEDCTITIGRVVPLTGALADVGKDTPWIDEFKTGIVNDAGGLTVGNQRCKVAFKIYDSKSTVAGSAEAATRAILKDKVNFLLAQGTPDTTNAPSDLCERNKVACVAANTPVEAWLYGPDGQPKKYEYAFEFFFSVGDLVKNHIGMMFVIGYGLQRLLLNHVTAQSAEARGLSPLQAMMLPLLVTFGLSITLSQVMLGVFSADAETIPNGLSFSSFRLTEDLSISTLRFCFFVAAGIITAALAYWLNHTHTGRSLRAASDDPDTAALMGMRTPHVYAVASGLSLAVASIAGFMIGMSRSFQPFDGPPYLLIAFGVVVIGGIGSLSGVFLGGITLGIVQVFAGTFLGPAAQQIAGYIFILAVLALRPNGIFSRAHR